MDTHYAPSPALDQEADALHARLPGELEDASSIPGPVSEQEALAAGARLPSSENRRPSARRKGLLAGAAVAAVLAVGGGAYLASSYNHIYPMPRLASTVRNTAAQVGVKLPPVLAPSASLATVNVPPQSPATRDPYAPKTREQEVAELLSLHNGAGSGPAPTLAAAPGPRASGASHSDNAVPSEKPALRVAGIDVPSGYVASEPGSTLPAVGLIHLDPARPEPPPAAHAVQQDPTASVMSGEPQTRPQPPSSTDAISAPPAAPAVSAPAPGSANPVAPNQPADPIAVAQTLRPGPMSSADQVQVLGLVTEMASMVRDLKKQNAQLRADFGKSTADTSAHLRDYERRLLLAEAKNAVSAASDTGAEQVVQQTVAEPLSPVRPTPIALTRAIAIVPAPAGAAAVKLYRVQAASPGLALLAQVDRGGGEGAQIQVAVGDNVPDYGRVKSISQKGTAWVVITEHGPIQ